jgi:hypothetical protein
VSQADRKPITTTLSNRRCPIPSKERPRSTPTPTPVFPRPLLLTRNLHCYIIIRIRSGRVKHLEKMPKKEKVSPSTIPWFESSFLHLKRTTHNVNMGIQSQNREGSIKKAMKRGTKIKNRAASSKQAAIDGGLAFDAEYHCIVCRARRLIRSGIPTTVPKRKHDPRCSKNTTTHGMSPTTVFVEKETARYIAANRAPIVAAPAPPAGTQSFFQKKITNRTISTKPSSMIPSHPPVTKARNNLASPTNLRRELESRIKVLDRGDEKGTYKWARNNKYATALGLLVDYMCSKFVHKRGATTPAAQEAIATYRQFFLPGSLSFTFPMEVNDQGTSPSPHYHALEGQTILLIDWELAFPSVDLLCYNCKHFSPEKADRQLERLRSNFSDKKLLFPIWSHCGLPTWCVAMR